MISWCRDDAQYSNTVCHRSCSLLSAYHTVFKQPFASKNVAKFEFLSWMLLLQWLTLDPIPKQGEDNRTLCNICISYDVHYINTLQRTRVLGVHHTIFNIVPFSKFHRQRSAATTRPRWIRPCQHMWVCNPSIFDIGITPSIHHSTISVQYSRGRGSSLEAVQHSSASTVVNDSWEYVHCLPHSLYSLMPPHCLSIIRGRLK